MLTRRTRASALALAAGLHLALFLAVAPPRCTTEQPQRAPPPPPSTDTVLEVRLLPSEPGDGPPCPRWYTGIGVRHFWGVNLVEVVAGGPAEKAGARVGDTFLNHDEFEPNRYAVGVTKVLELERDGVKLKLPVVIGRICQEK